MKATSTILYEVNFAEIKALPINYTVLQRNKDSGVYRLLKAHIDYFSFMKKFEYYVFQAPPLPKNVMTNAVEVGLN